MNEDEKKPSLAFAEYVKKRALATTVVRKHAPGTLRPWQVSFGPVTVLPGETETLKAQPKVLFRGERLHAGCGKGSLDDKTTWDNGGAEDLWVTAMYVGKTSQFKKVQELPFTLLSVDPWTGNGGFDPCNPALTIEIEVTNRGDGPRIADLTLFGQCVM